MKSRKLEEGLIKRILPELEEIIAYRIGRRIVEVIQEEIYPPESAFKRKFIKSVKEAQRRIGKGKKFKSVKELQNFLESLER